MTSPDRKRDPVNRRVVIGMAAALLYAGLALGSGLDRAAPAHQDLAQWVPGPLRAQSLTTEARRLVAVGIPASALEPSRRAVARDPADPSTSALLGTALLARRDPVGADRAFRIAAQGGWRDVLAQTYWLQAALAAGDSKAAVTRFDALARQYPSAPVLVEAARLIEASPEGRMALARQLAGGTNWARAYATLDSAAPPRQLHDRAVVLIATAALGRVLGCDTVRSAVGALGQSDPLTAAQVWRGHCPDARAGGVPSDGGFERQGEARVPFDWEFPGHGDLESIAAVRPGGTIGRTVRTTAATALPVAAQLVPLAPGSWRLSWTGSGRLRATLSCQRGVQGPNGWATVPDGAGRRHVETVVVDGSCAARWLQLWIAAGPGEASFDDVRLDRID
jgi:hypothetical protein